MLLCGVIQVFQHLTPISMFTVQDIQSAHSQVKSGADFPAYIRAIKALGVTHYTAHVSDGHVDYHGADAYTVTAPPKYAALQIADRPDPVGFQTILRAHQQGETDYLTFIAQCAVHGIAHWRVALDDMTCSYYDQAGGLVLVEAIPG